MTRRDRSLRYASGKNTRAGPSSATRTERHIWGENLPLVWDWISKLCNQINGDVQTEIKITLNQINPVRSQIDSAGLEILLVLIEENINNHSFLEWTTENS